MDFNYTDEQSMLAEAVGRWLATDYDFARRRRLAAGEESWESNWRQFADLGLLGLNVPESEGGMGGGSVEALIVMQALGRALVVEPYVQTALVSAPLLAQSGSPAQRAYSPRYAARTFGSLSMSLPGPVMVIRPDSMT